MELNVVIIFFIKKIMLVLCPDRSFIPDPTGQWAGNFAVTHGGLTASEF